jgi:hypothetical protein
VVSFFIVSPVLKLPELARGVRDNRHDPVPLWELPPEIIAINWRQMTFGGKRRGGHSKLLSICSPGRILGNNEKYK